MAAPMNRRKQIQLPLDPLKDIAIEARSFVKGFREYDSAVRSIRHFATPLSLCQPILNYLDAVDYAALDARQQLARSLELGRFEDLNERMQIEGISLENLQTGIHIDLSGLAEDNPLTKDLEEFFDRFIEATTQPTFTLAAYLMRAVF